MRYRLLVMLAIVLSSPLAVYGDEIELRQTACRLFDSRQIGGLNAGPKITSATIETTDPALDTVAFTANGRSYNAQGGEAGCRVPATATGAILSVVLFQPDGVGNATIWPAGSTQPLSTSINSSGSLNEVSGVMVSLGSGGDLSLASTISGAHYVIDLSGSSQNAENTLFHGAVVSNQAFGSARRVWLSGNPIPISCGAPHVDPEDCSAENLPVGQELWGTGHIDGGEQIVVHRLVVYQED